MRVAWGTLFGGREGPTNDGRGREGGFDRSGSTGPTSGACVVRSRGAGAAVAGTLGSGVLKTVLGGFSLMELGVVTWCAWLPPLGVAPAAAAAASSSYSYS